jgi:uncharacterized membrane protein (DUF2068 family)
VARRWFDPSQPQTLQAAVLFCYVNAALALLSLLVGAGSLSLLLLVEGVAANGIANDQRWGYWLGIATAVLYLLLAVVGLFTFSHSIGSLLNIAFAAILVALLLHPQSRAYQRVWFH